MNMTIAHPLASLLTNTKVVLGSQSPRRVQLLQELLGEIPFEVRPSFATEEHKEITNPKDVPLYLAQCKANQLFSELSDTELLITADTVVIQGDEILEKPRDLQDAQLFLRRLSDKWHEVITSYCLTTRAKQYSASVSTNIRFNAIEEREIEYYTNHYEVLDKAGAYGIQDWIGLIGVKEICGSYHNVMGLPTAHLYQHLKQFLSNH